MKIKLAFAAVTVTTLVAVLLTGCGPKDADKPRPEPITACATEDAKGPCVWDAWNQGNLEGESFEVLPDGTVVPWNV